MRYNYEKLLTEPARTFRTHDEIGPVIKCNFHVHPEYELTYIVSSCGTRFVGDNIAMFDTGDLALIGPMVPHHYYNSPSDSRSAAWGHARIVQFKDDFAGILLFQLPEFSPIRKMLDAARYGLSFAPETARRAAPVLNRLFLADGPDRVILLLRLLALLADADYRQLSTVAGDERLAVLPGRMDEVIRYIHSCLENNRPVSLEQTARKASMNPQAFSRYFRKTTFKRFIDYVNEIKIGKACRLLLNTDRTVAEICFDAGFNNLSNFNRHFLRVKKISPREFREQFYRHRNSGAQS